MARADGRSRPGSNLSPRDLEPVAVALIDGPYPEFGGARLCDVLAFSSAEPDRAEEDAGLLENWQPKSENLRTLLASARIAFAADPAKYEPGGVHSRVLNHIPRRTGIRAEQHSGRTGELQSIEVRDRDTGRALPDLMDRLRANAAAKI